jgi:hypothetical protein
MVKM